MMKMSFSVIPFRPFMAWKLIVFGASFTPFEITIAFWLAVVISVASDETHFFAALGSNRTGTLIGYTSGKLVRSSRIGRRCLDVQSRHLVERDEPERLGLVCPSFADELVGREPLQGL